MSDGKQLGYLWYSEGGKPTAPEMVSSLGLHGGMKQPEDFSKFNVVWVWGAKMPEKLREKSLKAALESGTRIINPIKAVSRAKNRRNLFQLWQQNKVPTLPIIPVSLLRDGVGQVHAFTSPAGMNLDISKLVYPCVFQDDTSNWTSPLCCSPQDVGAIRSLLRADGPQGKIASGFFRPLLSGLEEFRVHIFCTTPLFVEQRTRTEDFEAACRTEVAAACMRSKAQMTEESKASLAKELAQAFGFLGNSPALSGANWGWETRTVPLPTVPREVISTAIAALAAAELDAGVVSVYCTRNRNQKVESLFAVSCSTSPSLDAAGRERYTTEFRNFLNRMPVAAQAAPVADQKVAAVAADRQARRAQVLAAALEALDSNDQANPEQIIAAIRGSVRVKTA